MRQNEVEDLMKAMNQPKVVQTLQEEDFSGDDPTAALLPDATQ